MRKISQRESGFTLIELVVTVAIVGVLALMATPLIDVAMQRQKESELKVALRQIRTGIDAYRQAVIDKRIESPTDSTGYPPDLTVLVNGVPDITKPNKPKIYFLRQLPRDPLNTDPELKPEQTWGKRSYASSHDEPREGRDVFDVYSKAPGKGLNGIAYREW